MIKMLGFILLVFGLYVYIKNVFQLQKVYGSFFLIDKQNGHYSVL